MTKPKKAKTPKFKNAQLAFDWERFQNMELTTQDVRTDLIQDDEPVWLLDIADATFNYHEKAELDHDLQLFKKSVKLKYIPTIQEDIESCLKVATMYRDVAAKELKKRYEALNKSVDDSPYGHANELAWNIDALAKHANEMNYGNRIVTDLTTIAESDSDDDKKKKDFTAIAMKSQDDLTGFYFTNSTSDGQNLVNNQHKYNAIKLFHGLLKGFIN